MKISIPRWLTLPSWLRRMFTFPKDKNSLEDWFGPEIGGMVRSLLQGFIATQVKQLVKDNYSDPDTLAIKLASDVNAAADPVYKFAAKTGNMFGKGVGDILVTIAKEKIYAELHEVATDKVGTSDELAAKVYDVIAKATKL